MAKTRASAKISKAPLLKKVLNKNFVKKLKQKREEKTSFKTDVPLPKIESPLSAVKLQSKAEKVKIRNSKTNEELMKLCRPISICLTRIKLSDFESKYYLKNYVSNA